jgi:hypothetical protein
MLYSQTGLWNDLPVTYTRNCLVETDTGRLNITGPLPGSVTLTEGKPFTMQVAVRYPYGTVQYQWRKDGQDLSGANAAVLSIDSASFAHAGRYTCLVSDDSPAVQESDPLQLTIVAKATMPAASTAALAGLALALAALGARRRRA